MKHPRLRIQETAPLGGSTCRILRPSRLRSVLQLRANPPPKQHLRAETTSKTSRTKSAVRSLQGARHSLSRRCLFHLRLKGRPGKPRRTFCWATLHFGRCHSSTDQLQETAKHYAAKRAAKKFNRSSHTAPELETMRHSFRHLYPRKGCFRILTPRPAAMVICWFRLANVKIWWFCGLYFFLAKTAGSLKILPLEMIFLIRASLYFVHLNHCYSGMETNCLSVRTITHR